MKCKGACAFLSTEGHVHGCWMNIVSCRRAILLARFRIMLITASSATNVNIASSSQILSQDCKEHVMTLTIVSFK